MISKAQPSLVIFDFDGVIVDSEVMSLSELHKALQAFGANIDRAEVRNSFLGADIKKISAFVDRVGTRPSKTGFEDFWYDGLFKRFEEDLNLINGVSETFSLLDENGLEYCIASGGSFRRLGVAMSVTGIQNRFAGRTFSADLVERGKPSPDLFLHAASEMGYSPEQCLVIEDSPAGIAAAKSAGMQRFGFIGGSHVSDCETEHAKRLKDAGADRIVKDHLELKNLVFSNALSHTS